KIARKGPHQIPVRFSVAVSGALVRIVAEERRKRGRRGKARRAEPELVDARRVRSFELLHPEQVRERALDRRQLRRIRSFVVPAPTPKFSLSHAQRRRRYGLRSTAG